MNRRDFIKKSTWAVVFGTVASAMLPLSSRASIPIRVLNDSSTLDRINYRRIINEIKKDISNIGSYFVGELNDSHTRKHFNLTVADLIESIHPVDILKIMLYGALGLLTVPKTN